MSFYACELDALMHELMETLWYIIQSDQVINSVLLMLYTCVKLFWVFLTYSTYIVHNIVHYYFHVLPTVCESRKLYNFNMHKVGHM